MLVLCTDYYMWFGAKRFPESGKASARDDAVSCSLSLEEEIHILRKRMEQLFMQEKSLTSDNVVEISSKLDLKIIEYMKRHSRNK
ncbi:aspartyl-phosphate phosphatase Spo0E family protein [Paenibacillus zanthoxyli]|uniref:aspartyl-phosphate phosphatase Spo0E family protein n=1 Tax=Paenibacillus zanthoxyli TaxID=369399 RepID=UPI0004704E11|nr:aspartyl-phosphate phosphatase Spo0E family protein [Paenibacillus zanthoxyli]